MATSTMKDEYTDVGSCCDQTLWITQILVDFGRKLDNIHIYCDNTSAINLTKNATQHSRTKHIEIRHHFIRDHVKKSGISLELEITDKQITYIFVKPLNKHQSCAFLLELGMEIPP